MLRCLLVSFLVTITAFHLCSGCSFTHEWREKTFLQRASQAEIIVNGVVTNLYPMPDFPSFFPDAYIAEFEIDCSFKGSQQKCPDLDPNQGGYCIEKCSTNDDCSYIDEMCCSNGCGHTCQSFVTYTTVGKYVNVTGMGYLTSCSTTDVDIGTEYIMLLRTNDDGELEPDDINLQTAAFAADDEHWSQLGVLCSVATTPPVGEQSCSAEVVSRQIQEVDGCFSGGVSTFLGHSAIIILVISFILNSMRI